MGWITFNKPKHITPTEYFKNTFANEPNHELLDVAIVKRTQCYMAVKLKDTGEVIALVYMLTYARGYYNFGYKSMSEFCGPNISECPKRILKLLSPLNDENDPNGWAREWRKRCQDNIDGRTAGVKVNEGDIIKLEKPIGFTSGYDFQYFRKQSRRNRWTAMVEVNNDKGGMELMERGTVRFKAGNFKFEIHERLN
jgi:hypothetical protein